MNPCERIGDLIGPYLYGELSEGENDEVEKHLKSCQRCRLDVAERRTTLAILARGTPTRVERERVLRRVWAAVAASHGRRGVPQLARPALTMAGGLAVAALLFLGGIWVGWRTSSEPGVRSAVATVRAPREIPTPVAASPEETQPRDSKAHSPSLRPTPAVAATVERRAPRPPPARVQVISLPPMVVPVPNGVDDVRLASMEE